MAFIHRRDFLKRTLATGAALTLPGALDAQAAHSGSFLSAKLAALPRFVDPLPTLKRHSPLKASVHAATYHVRMMECAHKLHSSLPPTRLWGYEGAYPGPTFEAVRGQRVEVTWENHLPAKHLFAIDSHIHGAMPPSPAVRTVPHLHGSRTTSVSDGLPEKWFTPGQSVHYVYPNEQHAATLWYHDHAVGITRLNVYAGLSGLYLLREPDEARFELPAGDYEIPLIVQDRTLDEAGQLVYAPTHDDGIPLPPGVWGPEFFGFLPLVNGAIYPYVDVEPRPYRLRFLNGSNSRFFGLQFNLAHRATDVPRLVDVQQIGTDGGFLPRAVATSRLLLGPAERADVILDFSQLAGSTITLNNNAIAPYPGWGMLGMHAPRFDEMMQFRVVLPRKATTTSFSIQLPETAKPVEESESVKARDLVLIERFDEKGHSLGVRINDKGYDDPVTETVKLGTTETWRFINTTEDAHPMHLHLVQFRVLHRQGFDPVEFRKGVVKPVGPLRPPPPNEAGWKDTAIVLPNEMLTIVARFEGYTGKYVFHCHMLEHEDNDMMRPFEVVS